MDEFKDLPPVKGLGEDVALRTGPKREPPDIPRTTGFATVRYDEELSRWIWLLGNTPEAVKRAKQCRAKQETYPFATFPELLCLIWLDQKGIPYQFQEYVLGGRNRAGGVVPDVLIPQGSGWLVWSVVGAYWHSERFQSDASDRLVIKASTIQGFPVEAFVIIVEDDLFTQWDEVLSAAYVGIEWNRDV